MSMNDRELKHLADYVARTHLGLTDFLLEEIPENEREWVIFHIEGLSGWRETVKLKHWASHEYKREILIGASGNGKRVLYARIKTLLFRGEDHGHSSG